MDILSSRSEPGFGRAEAIVLAAYSLLVAWTLAHHELWADEAQAWLLARDSSLPALFGTNLHYEGSPGLWHLLLWMLCRMHVSYLAMHWIAAVIPAACIWVFLRYSPFPLILRATLPFTFYMAYQYAVIARSYVAVPLLVLSAAALFREPEKHLAWLAAVLGLLSNLCAQGFVLSVGFAFVLSIHLWKRRGLGARFPRSSRLAGSCAILGAFWAAAIWTAAPAADNNYLPPSHLAHRQSGSASGAEIEGRSAAVAQSPAIQSGPPQSIPEGRTPQRALAKLKIALTYGLSNSWLLSSIVLAAVSAYLLSKGRILDLAPYFLLQVFCEFVLCRPWHLGLLFVALIGILWIDWPRKEGGRTPAWTVLLTLAVLAVAVEQGLWSWRAIAADSRGIYSGDRQAADFLRSRISGKRVAGFQFWSVGVLPYFPSNIFFNQHRQGFWLWSTTAHVDDRAMEILETRPDYIVIGFSGPGESSRDAAGSQAASGIYRPELESRILATGLYAEAHRFCGDAFSGHGYHEELCQAILEPSAR